MANDLEKDCIEFTVELLKGYRELCLHLDELKSFKDTLKCDYTAKSIMTKRRYHQLIKFLKKYKKRLLGL
ncbi:hypothetical protein NSA24_09825 [Clostridioides mangenotii]|uniref:hypothetical protein n=1 Tax=Metaclostridioides mangenotii TaxID=1540 RepID=UPI00214A56DB|nr:hypothetical protein [Clostridioides mangenotii]MCR1955090.1 hypothetical protein [Clostridioides mangenotii]